MTEQKADTGSLVVSYLWSRRGQALEAELVMALQKPRDEVMTAVAVMQRAGWVDRVYDELPAVRLSPQALEALHAHVNYGTPLPERVERAHEREARLRQAEVASQVQMATLMNEMRAEQVAMREERRLMLEALQRTGALPGPAPAPRQLDVKCVCGPLFFPDEKGTGCGRCGRPT
jgi:hypothetical protein